MSYSSDNPFAGQDPPQGLSSDNPFAPPRRGRLGSFLAKAGKTLGQGMLNASGLGGFMETEDLPGVARATAQGASLGASDEIEAGVRTALGKRPYGENVAGVRESMREFGEEHPVLNIAGNLAGGAATGLATAGLAGPALATGKGLLAATAGTGAITGFNTSEGSARERVPGAVVGAGVALGTLGLLKGAGALGSKVLDVLGARPATSASPAGQAAGAIGIESAEERALRQLGTAIGRDETTPQAIAEAAASETKPRMFAEFAGDNTLGKMRAARTVPGLGKNRIPEALNERAGGAQERILDDLLETTGLGSRTNTFRMADDIIRERAETAKPLYEAAHSLEIKDDRLRSFLKIPQFRNAYERYARIAEIKGEAVPDIDKLIEEGGSIPVRVLDYVKRGMDDVIDSGMRGGSMGKEEARALKGRLNQMLDVTDELVPEFMQARGYYKGESDLLEALEQGRQLAKMPAGAAETILRDPKVTEGERELMRRGMLEAFAEKLEGAPTGHDVSRRIAGNTLDARKLRLLFDDDESFNRFMARREGEAGMHRTRQFVLGGSNTTDKLAEVAEMGDVDIGSVLQAATGNPSGLLKGAAMQALRNRMAGTTTDVANALTPRLTAQGPAIGDVARELEEFARRQAASGVRRRGIAAALSGQSGGYGGRNW